MDECLCSRHESMDTYYHVVWITWSDLPPRRNPYSSCCTAYRTGYVIPHRHHAVQPSKCHLHRRFRSNISDSNELVESPRPLPAAVSSHLDLPILRSCR